REAARAAARAAPADLVLFAGGAARSAVLRIIEEVRLAAVVGLQVAVAEELVAREHALSGRANRRGVRRVGQRRALDVTRTAMVDVARGVDRAEAVTWASVPGGRAFGRYAETVRHRARVWREKSLAVGRRICDRACTRRLRQDREARDRAD